MKLRTFFYHIYVQKLFHPDSKICTIAAVSSVYIFLHKTFLVKLENKRESMLLCVSLFCLCFCSYKGHYSCSVLTVVRWPMCDCRDNPYQRLVGCCVAGAGLCLFWFQRRENLLSSSLCPSANSPPWLITKKPKDKERDGHVLTSVLY